MAKLATIQLLVNDNDEENIAESLALLIEDLTAPDRRQSNSPAFIIDHRMLPGVQRVSGEVDEAVRTGTYLLGSAFGSTGFEQDHYLLIMEGDVDPMLCGPFDSDADRIAKAISYREMNSDEDGLYRLDVPKGTPVDLHCFLGMELVSNPMAEDLWRRLRLGEKPIMKRPGQAGFSHSLGEVPVEITVEDVLAIETLSGEALVVVNIDQVDYIVLKGNLRALVSKEEWLDAVSNGTTESGFHDWREDRFSQLPNATEVLANG